MTALVYSSGAFYPSRPPTIILTLPTMHIITSHLSADFDSLSSMIAAQKLYPDALLTFPGSQKKNVREFISQTLLYRYEFQKAKTIDPAKVDMLIVVDTRSSERIGHLSACLANPGIKVHLYDHHPVIVGDIRGDLEIVRNVGSTTTILINELKKREIDISVDEATILGLGIYEDTGSLTHLTTTPEDLIAAAWLLEKGAKLDTIAQFITYDLTSTQVELLHSLMKTATQYTIQGIPIVVVTLSLPVYVDDFAMIARRFMHMENLDTLFALISMADRIYLIARSRIAEVNVGIIARDLGGGGHATAASATLRDMTMTEAQEKLIQTLHRHVLPQPIAREMMSKPAITIPADTAIVEANEILTRYSITAMPVLSPLVVAEADTLLPSQSILGIISRIVVEKAIHHDLGYLPVSTYMTSDIATLPPDATLADIQELIIEHHQRLIPIVDNGVLQGIITRTDLLNRLVNDPAHLPKKLRYESEHPLLERKRNLNAIIIECLDKPMIELLQKIGAIADELQFNAFAVGGFVRDLLLKKTNTDLDIVIEGDGIQFAENLARKLQGRIKPHERFGTATVVLPSGTKIDIATARLEYYEYPAALPTVELSSTKLDLYRRDFTINAMAIQLNPERFGTLIDFFNCQNDLDQRLIKVLHNLSFVEDPSRIFRAIRFEARMAFEIAPHTRRLMHNAVSMRLFGKTDDPRFFSELKQILSEEDPVPALQRLAEFNLFPFLWPELKPHLKIDRRFLYILHQAQSVISWFRLLCFDEPCNNWMVYLLAIMSRSPDEALAAFCCRFQIPQKVTDRLLWQKIHAEKTANLLSRREIIANSEIYGLLKELSVEGLLYLMALARKNQVKKAVSNYVTSLRYIRIDLTGDDLMALGYLPGPEFKMILNNLLDARLDDLVHNREEEIALVRRAFSPGSFAAAGPRA